MALFTASQHEQAECVSALAGCNPFRSTRIELEQALLGDAFESIDRVWNRRPDMPGDNPNVLALGDAAQALLDAVHQRLASGERPSGEVELELYDDLLGYCLFHRYRDAFSDLLYRSGPKPKRVDFYSPFEQDAHHFQAGLRDHLTAAPHLFALFFQVRRAFHQIYSGIIGGSLAMAELRASIWESIFTHDFKRYRRCLYNRLGDLPTLVTGETGTGKELVAQAVGLSRYIPFDAASQTFAGSVSTCFRALNLSALSPTLIESELFGHRRGAFTGALDDKQGWLEACGPLDTVFLDEIGDLDPAIQVKLLRVLQSRTFQRLGDLEERRFEGKIVAATHCDLARQMVAGSFRQDFYYRLCADQIETVPLRVLLRDPQQLPVFVGHLARQLVGEAEGERLTRQVTAWIETQLGPDYPWPGNVRELEQCIRNILIHNTYHPAPAAGDARQRLTDALAQGDFSADELVRWYCSITYARTGSYQATARELGLDRRTVKARIDEELQQRFPL